MDVQNAILNRRSVRDFNSKPVEFEKLTMILEAAAHAPSAGDLKDFKFLVVTDKALIKQIAENSQHQYWMAKAPMFIMVLSDFGQTKELYKERGERLYSVQNSAAAIQNILLSAHSMGLSSCWVGSFDENKIKVLLGIPDNVRPQAIIPIGYSDENPQMDKEPNLQTMVYFNGYGSKVKNMNILLREYSKEIEKVSGDTQGFFDKLTEKINSFFKK
ncbi:MAG: nitroreductase family protein [Candidatus Woesearchaeota archaeon]